MTSALGSQRRTKGKETAEELRVSCPEYTKIIEHFPPHLTQRILLLECGWGVLMGDHRCYVLHDYTELGHLGMIHKDLDFLITFT